MVSFATTCKPLHCSSRQVSRDRLKRGKNRRYAFNVPRRDSETYFVLACELNAAYYIPEWWNGVVAQLVERLVRNEKVAGSIPVGSTILRSERDSVPSEGWCPP